MCLVRFLQIKKSWLNISPRVHAFFFSFKGVRGTSRGENNCAQHRSKGTTLDTDKGKQHPRCFAKARRTEEEEERVGGSSVGHMSALLTTQISRKLHRTDQEEKNQRSHIKVWGLNSRGAQWQQRHSSSPSFFCPCFMWRSSFLCTKWRYQTDECQCEELRVVSRSVKVQSDMCPSKKLFPGEGAIFRQNNKDKYSKMLNVLGFTESRHLEKFVS